MVINVLVKVIKFKLLKVVILIILIHLVEVYVLQLLLQQKYVIIMKVIQEPLFKIIIQQNVKVVMCTVQEGIMDGVFRICQYVLRLKQQSELVLQDIFKMEIFVIKQLMLLMNNIKY